jgi:hypothetical protein
MKTVLISFTEYALVLRETTNIVITTTFSVLSVLFIWHVGKELADKGYRNAEWLTKLLVGLLVIFIGDLFRSATIWEILHFEGSRGTYLSDVVPLLFSLGLIILGALCVIRVMTPRPLGHFVWLGTVIFTGVVIAINYWL